MGNDDDSRCLQTQVLKSRLWLSGLSLFQKQVLEGHRCGNPVGMNKGMGGKVAESNMVPVTERHIQEQSSDACPPLAKVIKINECSSTI